MVMKARGASKVEEKDILSKAKMLADKPELILPVCTLKKKCVVCPFDKTKNSLYKIQKMKDDQNKLKFQSKWAWDKLARAYAGLLLLPHSDANLYMLVANYPAGTVSYILNCRAPKEKLIGIQHYDDPKWRLMAYMDFARQGFHLYSSRDRLYCSGLAPLPPAQFVKDAVARARYPLKSDADGYKCVHAAQKEKLSSIRLRWHSAKVSLLVCENCCSPDENLFCKITETSLAREPKDDFEVDAKFGMNCRTECGECALEEIKLDTVLAERYLTGEISDEKLMSEYLADAQSHLMHIGRKLYVAGSDCYGTDMEKFISALNPTDDEKMALGTVLKMMDSPLLVDSPTPSKVLSICWKEYGQSAIESVVKDKKLAEEMYNKYSDWQPSRILREAQVRMKEKEILSSLPEYAELPPVAEFADRLARTYRTAGLKDCLQILEKTEKKDIKTKSVAYAFLLALNLHEGKGWQYSKEEKEFAEFLKDYAKALLDADAKNYHAALQNLLAASGAGGEIKAKKK